MSGNGALQMHEKTKFTVGGIPVFLNKEEVEQKLLLVMPEEDLELARRNKKKHGRSQ